MTEAEGETVQQVLDRFVIVLPPASLVGVFFIERDRIDSNRGSMLVRLPQERVPAMRRRLKKSKKRSMNMKQLQVLSTACVIALLPSVAFGADDLSVKEETKKEEKYRKQGEKTEKEKAKEEAMDKKRDRDADKISDPCKIKDLPECN